MAEIVGIVTGLVGPAIELGKCVIAPIKRQFNYLCCFNSNIKSLRDEAKKLNDVRVGLQMRVDEAENKAQVIVPEVEAWLTSANSEIEGHLIEIEDEISKVQSGFFTIKLPFSLSKKARKSTEAMKKLQEQCDFNPISTARPPPATVSIPLGPTSYEFESRKRIEEVIMEALRSKKVKVMGICGMGGVGKTMMAKRIMNRVKEEHLFDEVLMSVVSQQVDVMKIQSEIAESLGLKLEEGTLFARAHQLHTRLQGKKRTLIVLDDIWERLKLEDLGLTPCESGVEGNCTILLTSRDKDVLNAMGAKQVFGIQTLSETEAWFLFKEKVGNCVDDMNLFSIAKQVANECRGLPIALITVGNTLKDRTFKPIWEDALQQLKDSNPIDVPNVLRDVYNPLKLSYEFLDSQHARYLFLLCCLFPEDSYISLEHLTMCCIGLRMFEGIRNLEQVRNRVFALVEMLKNRFLLLDGHAKHDVRMHDVVRDVANYIASKERFIDRNLQTMNWFGDQYSHGDCKWISLFLRKESRLPIPIRLDFPSLSLLMMHGRDMEEFELKDFHFFEGMKGLNVLSFKSIWFKSSPKSIRLLKNLRTLRLEKCILESISIVGELPSLEILSCKECHEIQELPIEMGRLNHLKLLEFSNCPRLKRIVPGIMSNLVSLEELIMVASFKRWEVANASREKGRNASLNELQSLSNLTCLDIEVEDYNLVAEEMHFSSKIVKYRVFVNLKLSQKEDVDDKRNYEKAIALQLPREITLGNWIQIFLRHTEDLILVGNGSNSLDLSQAQNVKTLIFTDCSTIKNLVNTITSNHWRRFGVFPVLERLGLFSLPNLEEICQGPIRDGSNSFKNLREVIIGDLPALRTLWKSADQNISLGNLSSLNILRCAKLLNLFPLTVAKGLSQLEELIIFDCEMMEQLFPNNESRTKSHITFPKLKQLSLHNLQNLSTLCEGIECIDFPALIAMDITECSKLMPCVSSAIKYEDSANEDFFLLFYNQKVSVPILKLLKLSHVRNLEQMYDGPIIEGFNFFKNLKKLIIDHWPALKHLWKSRSITNNIRNKEDVCDKKDGLLQLEELEINGCELLEQVLLNEKKKYHEQYHLTFPKLQTLKLNCLPNLTTFSKGIEIINFPVLNGIYIDQCPKLTTIVSPIGSNGHDDDTFHLFCTQKVTFGKLEDVKIIGCNTISNIWCHQIPYGFFNGLKELEISKCDSIRSLFSSAIARKLVNLKELRIERCKKMVKVIENEEEITRETNGL